MKRPKRLTRSQKVKLNANGYNPDKYMLLNEATDTFIVIAKENDDNGKRKTASFTK